MSVILFMESLSLVFWVVFNDLVVPEAESSFGKLLIDPRMANLLRECDC